MIWCLEIHTNLGYEFQITGETGIAGHDVFDLLYGESPVADVINPAVAASDSKLTISWVNPDDSNYVGARVDVRTNGRTLCFLDTIWSCG